MRGMTRKAVVLFLGFGLLLALMIVADAQEPTTLYVATNGNDAWSGGLDAPEASGADGPLATLTGARDAIRRMRAEGALSGPVKVLIRGGVYPLSEALVFGPEDSGSADAPIVYEAYPGETPVLHGGRPVRGWREDGAFWVAEVPEVRTGEWDFSALWVNGRRAMPARTPNATNDAGDYPEDSDFFYTEGPVMETDPATGKESKSATKFQYRSGDIEDWPSLKDAMVVVFHSWATSEHRIKGIDRENRIIEFTGPARWQFGNWRNDQWYFIEHLFEGLDQPGEWYLNRDEGKVYYIPREDEDMRRAEVIAPVAQQLLLVEGVAAEGRFVEHLSFRGIHFHYTEYTIAPEGHSDAQAAFTVPAAVQFSGARHCLVEGCEIGHVGTYGLWFRAGCQDNQVIRTEMFDLGAGGVRIGEGSDPPTEAEAALRNRVENCFLHDGGRIFRHAVGVWIGRSSYNTIAHNDVCDFRYSGMSIGWSWGYAPSSANHNIIEYNHIHNVGKGQLSDMGGIYTLGDSPGTVLRYNYIHDVLSNPKISGGWGLYTDEGSTGILMENNIVHNTVTGTFHQHYGKENRLVNNILAFSQREQLIRSREEEHISFFLDRNIIYFSNGRLLGSTWKNGNYRFDNNLYWDSSGEGFDFAGRSFEEWQAAGYDQNSIIADPLFADIEGRDFTLSPESPAFKIGFEPIDMSKIGLYGDPEWVNKPKAIPRRPFEAPRPQEPVRIAHDFEDVPVGRTAPDAETLGEEGSATIRVTDETAASGKHSLKFTDAAGLRQPFNPHLVYTPHFRRGLVVGSFSLRHEPGAIFFHEWRDSRSPYRIGPSLWIQGDGEVKVGGVTLAAIPPSEWVRFRITCALGQKADGSWLLELTMPGGEVKTFDGLACGNPQFNRLDWFGFVSNTSKESVFYLDGVLCEVAQ